MTLTLQECIDKIKKEYSKMYPYVFVEIDGKYIFNLVQKGHDPESAISDMHVVDPESGYISGGISIMEFLKNPRFREAWKKPNLVANHDSSSVSHSSMSGGLKGHRGWDVRRIQNGSKKRPFESSASTVGDDSLTYGGSLSHHGIKGQSWGTRNGPPYPLDQKTHNKVIKSAGKTARTSSGEEGTDGKTGLVPELIAISSLLAIKAYVSSPKYQTKMKTKIQNQANTRNQELSKDLIGDIAEVGKTYSAENMPRQIKGSHTPEQDMAACNPRYKNGVVPGTAVNCTLCAFTYDLRRRGYDVTALSCDSGSYPDILMKDLYKDAKQDFMSANTFSDLYDKAAKTYPEGSRGNISVYGPFMGHTMSWEVRGGKLEILDTQRNVKVSPQDLVELGFSPKHKQINFIRTDNLELNPAGINHVSAELKPGWKKTIAAEQKSLPKAAGTNNKIMTFSEAERRKKYEEAYLKEHPNADKNSEGLRNWVDAQMNK